MNTNWNASGMKSSTDCVSLCASVCFNLFAEALDATTHCRFPALHRPYHVRREEVKLKLLILKLNRQNCMVTILVILIRVEITSPALSRHFLLHQRWLQYLDPHPLAEVANDPTFPSSAATPVVLTAKFWDIIISNP